MLQQVNSERSAFPSARHVGSTSRYARSCGRARPIEAAPQTVDVLAQVGRNVLPKRVEDNLHTFSSGELYCWDEIRVAGDEDNNAGLSLECDRRDVDADPHINAFLPEGGHKMPVVNL